MVSTEVLCKLQQSAAGLQTHLQSLLHPECLSHCQTQHRGALCNPKAHLLLQKDLKEVGRLVRRSLALKLADLKMQRVKAQILSLV